jgi:hypothetical protein
MGVVLNCTLARMIYIIYRCRGCEEDDHHAGARDDNTSG